MRPILGVLLLLIATACNDTRQSAAKPQMLADEDPRPAQEAMATNAKPAPAPEEPPDGKAQAALQDLDARAAVTPQAKPAPLPAEPRPVK